MNWLKKISARPSKYGEKEIFIYDTYIRPIVGLQIINFKNNYLASNQNLKTLYYNFLEYYRDNKQPNNEILYKLKEEWDNIDRLKPGVKSTNQNKIAVIIFNQLLKEKLSALQVPIILDTNRFLAISKKENSQKINIALNNLSQHVQIENNVIINSNTEEVNRLSSILLDNIVEYYKELEDTSLRYKNRIYIHDSVPASFHEFIVSDILAICGIPFRREVDVSLDVYPRVIKARVDFLFSNNEIFEIFGFGTKSYNEKKEFKKIGIKKLWWIDCFDIKAPPFARTMDTYLNKLDNDCYFNENKMSLLGKNFNNLFYSRMPLLTDAHKDEINLYLGWLNNLDPKILSEIRDRVFKLNSISNNLDEVDDLSDIVSYKMSQKTNADYIISMDEINSILSSKYSSVRYLNNFEKIGLFFENSAHIMPFLNKISKDIDNLVNNNIKLEDNKKVNKNIAI